MSYSFTDLKKLILSRIQKIEIDQEKYAISDEYNEEEQEGRINVKYEDKDLVTFLYMVTNIRKDGRFKVRGGFVVKAQKYSPWFQDFLESGNDIVHVSEFFDAHSSNNDRHNVEYFLDKYLPIGKEEDKDKIANTFSDNGVDKTKVVFDTFKKNYVVELDLSNYLDLSVDKGHDGNTMYLYKYMSLDTFLFMTNRNTFRMNSIISMNDRYEGEWINYLLYGPEKVNDNTMLIDNLKNKNILVTSFTDKGDDGLMWIRYGNKGCGVSVGFEVPKKDVTKVFYVDEENNNFQKLRDKLLSLSKDGIQVSFISTQKMRYVVKSTTFTTENEYRFLFDACNEHLQTANYNGLLSTYKDFTINTTNGCIDGLPFCIKVIYLGRNIPNYITNVPILMSQIHETFPSTCVYESEVKEIR